MFDEVFDQIDLRYYASVLIPIRFEFLILEYLVELVFAERHSSRIAEAWLGEF